jgi:DNA-binding response OmpR family regulator
MARLLLVDDCEETGNLVRHTLCQSPELTLDVTKTTNEALDCLGKYRYDLILLDISLPDGDGLSLFSRIKTLSSCVGIPVIFLTSSNDITTKVTAFSLDADDFIVKPFNLLELRARVEARIRRQLSNRAGAEEYCVGPFVFEMATLRLLNSELGQYLDLTSREFKILLQLSRRPFWIFSRDQIIQAVWSESVHVSERTIDTHICLIRKKLGRWAGMIESVLGEGYRFNPNYTALEQAKTTG